MGALQPVPPMQPPVQQMQQMKPYVQPMQQMLCPVEAITNQQKKMNTDPSKWMPHGQMLHPKMNCKGEEKNGQ